MINIAKINNPKYLFKHSQHEYFSEGDNEKGIWAGSSTRYMKLEGKEVDQKTFTKFVNLGSDENKGVELDPSAPKDWSVLYNRVSAEDRAKMDTAMSEALMKTADTIQQNTYYRSTVNGKEEYVLAKGVTMAVFQHHTARTKGDSAIDCQEHGHIIVFPKVLGQDGKLYSHTLYDLINEKDGQGNNQDTLRYFDQTFQYHLAKFLTNEMGLTLSRGVEDSFTIDGISSDIRKSFSQRTEAINETAKDTDTYADKKKISLQQRNNKQENDIVKLRVEWQARMESLGFKEKDLEKMKGQQSNLDRNFEDTFSKFNVISNKRIKMMALSEAKFSSKSFEEKFKEFGESKKLLKINKNTYINGKNKSLKRLSEKLTKQKIDRAKSVLSENSNKNPVSVVKQQQKPAATNVRTSALKSVKGSVTKHSEKILNEISDLTARHASKMLEILSQNHGKIGKEGTLLSKEISNFNAENSKLMADFTYAIQKESLETLER